MLLTWYCLQFFQFSAGGCPLKKQDPHNPSLTCLLPHTPHPSAQSCSPSKDLLACYSPIQLNRQPAAQSCHASHTHLAFHGDVTAEKPGESHSTCFSPAHTLHTLLEIWDCLSASPPDWVAFGLSFLFSVCVLVLPCCCL